MSQKTINFCYMRGSVSHSEYAIIKSLNKFLEDDTKLTYKIVTSTAAIFTIVRAFCLKNKVDLVAQYEDVHLTLDKNMRMSDWSKCPDFDFAVDALEILLELAEE